MWKRYIDTVTIGLGIFLIGFGCYLVWERRAPLAQAAPLVVSVGNDPYPVRLVIPKLSIDLPIVPAAKREGTWETSREGISYITSTVMPGEQGNSVMYGHNWPNMLSNLKRVVPGDEIWVYSRDGQENRFAVVYTAVVTPDQTHIAIDTQDARLTIYTCTGFLDSKRFVVTAIPVVR